MTKTMHEIAIQKIIGRRPAEKLSTGNINDLLRQLIKEFNLWIEPEDFFDRRPDAWSYEAWENPEYPGTIKIYEVEDEHPITVEKLRDYTNVWFVLDSSEIDLRLFVYDRYGENERELSLSEYWFIFEKNSLPVVPPPPTRRQILYRKRILKQKLRARVS
jgi:hypothetical protein